MGDPVFDPDDDYHILFNPRDPDCADLIEMRRRCLLKLLDGLYQRLQVFEEVLEYRNKKFQEFKQEMLEEKAAELWTGLKLYDLAVRQDPKTADKIVEDRDVNRVDPDFSFRKALDQMRAEWDASP